MQCPRCNSNERAQRANALSRRCRTCGYQWQIVGQALPFTDVDIERPPAVTKWLWRIVFCAAYRRGDLAEAQRIVYDQAPDAFKLKTVDEVYQTLKHIDRCDHLIKCFVWAVFALMILKIIAYIM